MCAKCNYAQRWHNTFFNHHFYSLKVLYLHPLYFDHISSHYFPWATLMSHQPVSPYNLPVFCIIVVAIILLSSISDTCTQMGMGPSTGTCAAYPPKIGFPSMSGHQLCGGWGGVCEPLHCTCWNAEWFGIKRAVTTEAMQCLECVIFRWGKLIYRNNLRTSPHSHSSPQFNQIWVGVETLL